MTPGPYPVINNQITSLPMNEVLHRPYALSRLWDPIRKFDRIVLLLCGASVKQPLFLQSYKSEI